MTELNITRPNVGFEGMGHSTAAVQQSFFVYFLYCIKQDQKRKIFKGEYVFDIYKNKHGIWSQTFAAGVTIFWIPDEIKRFDCCLRNVKKAIYIKI